MKYYKKINNKFIGFYDEEINSEQLFDTVYKEKEINGKIMNVPVKILKPNFHELTDEKWQELLNGQSKGKEIRILKNGELGLYTFPPMPKNMINPIMDYDNDVWVEQATLEEQLSHWRNELIKADRKCREEQELFGVASQESLALKQKYMDLHMQVSHELALKQEVINNAG